MNGSPYNAKPRSKKKYAIFDPAHNSNDGADNGSKNESGSKIDDNSSGALKNHFLKKNAVRELTQTLKGVQVAIISWHNRIIFLVLSFATIVSLGARAAPGDLDPAFGINGTVVVGLGTTNSHVLTGVAEQTDGKYLVSFRAPQLFSVGGGIARFNADHTPDFSWGFRGVASTGNGYDGVIVNNGQVFAIEQSSYGEYPRNFVSRYTANGQLDSAFGYAGQTLAFPAGGSNYYLRYYAIAIAPDGKVVVVGEASGLLFVVRFRQSGMIDESFGMRGWLRLVVETDENFSPQNGNNFADGSTGYGVVIQADGKIIVTGNNKDFVSGNSRGFVARLGITGAFDASFNGNGIVRLDAASGPSTTVLLNASGALRCPTAARAAVEGLRDASAQSEAQCRNRGWLMALHRRQTRAGGSLRVWAVT